MNEFVVSSDLEFPGDVQMVPAASEADNAQERVVFRRASLAEVPSLLRRLRRQLVYDVGDGFLVEPHEDVAMHVDLKGRTITLDALDVRMPVALAWAVHAGLGAATLTHGGLPLHGAGLELDGRYVAVIAKSGAGKSTLSWHLIQNGFRFGNDDLVPIRITDENVTAFPSVSLYPKLGRSLVDQQNLTIADLLPADYGTGEEEYYVPLPVAQRVTEPHQLSTIVVLKPLFTCRRCGIEGETCGCNTSSSLAPGEIFTRRLNEEEATRLLLSNLHAVWLIAQWMDQKRLARLCNEVASRVPVYELSYRRSFMVLPRLTQVIRGLEQIAI